MLKTQIPPYKISFSFPIFVVFGAGLTKYNSQKWTIVLLFEIFEQIQY